MLTGCKATVGSGKEASSQNPMDVLEFAQIEEQIEKHSKEQTEKQIKEQTEKQITERNNKQIAKQREDRFTDPTAATFAYDQLTEAEKLWYQDINKLLGKMGTEISLSPKGIAAGLTPDHVDHIFQCVLTDHPEYFFVDGYVYTEYTREEALAGISFEATYTMDRQQALERKARIEAAVKQWFNGVSPSAGEYEKVKYVYEMLIRGTEYDDKAEDNQNICSVLLNGRSVCQGYAKAAQFLLQRLGVECSLVIGVVEGNVSHAWNLVKVDGAYYYMDPSWGDPSYVFFGEKTDKQPEISYDYLCITTEQLLKTHTPITQLALPVCDSMECNYYVQEGLYLTRIEEQKLQEIFAKLGTAQSRDDFVSVKCADAAVYEQLLQKLISDRGIFDYLADGDISIAYAENINQLTMTFWVTNS